MWKILDIQKELDLYPKFEHMLIASHMFLQPVLKTLNFVIGLF